MLLTVHVYRHQNYRVDVSLGTADTQLIGTKAKHSGLVVGHVAYTHLIIDLFHPRIYYLSNLFHRGLFERLILLGLDNPKLLFTQPPKLQIQGLELRPGFLQGNLRADLLHRFVSNLMTGGDELHYKL